MLQEKLKVGICGATGVVGQNYIKLLRNHPWFQVVDVAASSRSEGKTYAEAVKNKWQMSVNIPDNIKNLIVREAQDIDSIDPQIKFVFSAINLPNKEDIKELELNYARKGIPVISNNSAHRWTPDVPMIIPEINPDHINVIPIQQKNRNFSKGFVAVKPNCSIQSYMTPIYSLQKAGYKVDKMIVTTLQAVSGAGYPGVSSLDMIDNIVPFIGGEEEKSNDDSIKISATCTRVPVTDGHTACVNIKFQENIPSKDEIIDIWRSFRAIPQDLSLPYAPEQPIIYLENENRPQPKKDRDNDKGMAVTVGRLRKDQVFDYKFVALSHNTIRGAAGGAILNAELLLKKGFL
ncbi:MAG: aspartate-semialdehyde dehydrogenase [Promethearchaeota archaeon]